MDPKESEGRDWNDAIAQASQHVEERGAAATDASQKNRPRDQGPMLAGVIVLLALSLAWVGYRFQAPVEEIQINESVNLAWFVVDGIESIEDFRIDEGRLPDVNEASTLFDEGMVYTPSQDGYTLSIDDGDRTLEYSSDTPFADWVAIYATPFNGGEG